MTRAPILIRRSRLVENSAFTSGSVCGTDRARPASANTRQCGRRARHPTAVHAGLAGLRQKRAYRVQLISSCIKAAKLVQGAKRAESSIRRGDTRPLNLYAGKPRECGLDQANRITLTAVCCFDSSLSDDFEHHSRLTRVKYLQNRVKSFAHGHERFYWAGSCHQRRDFHLV
jgi:hypothetical protein